MLLKHQHFCIIWLKVQSAVCRVWRSSGKRKLTSGAEKSLWTVKETGWDEGQQIIMETVRQKVEASREELLQLRLIFSSFSKIHFSIEKKNNRKETKGFGLAPASVWNRVDTFDNWNVFFQIFQIPYQWQPMPDYLLLSCKFILWFEVC